MHQDMLKHYTSLNSGVIFKGGLHDIWVVEGFEVGVEVIYGGFEGNKEKG